MDNIQDEAKLFNHLFSMLEHHFGSDLEIVLHDLTGDPNHSIVDIRNGQITKRKSGDMEERHGIQVKPGIRLEDGSIYGEIVYTKDARILRSSTIKIYDSDDRIIGSICLNEDISKEVEFENYLRKRNGFHLDMQESYSQNINTFLDNLMQDALLHSGKHYDSMTKEDKFAYIKYLDERGAFLITKSGPKVCEALNITKSTLYTYLEKIRLRAPTQPE